MLAPAMRVTLLAPGSRGDVQPYVALGVGLARAGHAARVVTTMDHEALVRAHGLEVAVVPVSVQAALAGASTAKAVEGGGTVASFREFARIAQKASRALAEVGLEASRDADVVVTGFSAAFLADGIARRLGRPLVQAYNVPLTPTAAFPGALVGLDFGPASRRLGHALTRQALWLTGRQAANRALVEVLGQPPAPLLVGNRFPGLVEGPVLYGLSTAFLPRGPEWGDDVEVTGFWFADAPGDFSPPPALEAFLADGPPPVCLGFGSMSHTDAQATTGLVLDAVKQAQVRAVLLSGWGGLASATLPRDVYAVEGLPHDWLYPRCRAVVHHGGGGTTAAGLRAGVPAVVVPFHGDQPFWAKRVHAAGVGPRPIPRTRLAAKGLAEALREATQDEAMARRAQELGEAIRAEDGVGRAVAAIERRR